MDAENLFDEETEREQDKRNLERRNRLDSYFSVKPNVESDTDFLNNLEEDDDVKIEDLRKLINQLEEMKKEYETPETGNKKEKVKVLTNNENKYQNAKPEIDNTGKEIRESFESCSIYCMVTAIMGTLWFLYIINHI